MWIDKCSTLENLAILFKMLEVVNIGLVYSIINVLVHVNILKICLLGWILKLGMRIPV